MDPESNAIAQRISMKVKERGLSIAQFGKLIGKKKPTVAHYLDGSHKTPAKLLPRIAEVLGVSLKWLHGVTDDAGTEGKTSEEDGDDSPFTPPPGWRAVINEATEHDLTPAEVRLAIEYLARLKGT